MICHSAAASDLQVRNKVEINNDEMFSILIDQQTHIAMHRLIFRDQIQNAGSGHA